MTPPILPEDVVFQQDIGNVRVLDIARSGTDALTFNKF